MLDAEDLAEVAAERLLSAVKAAARMPMTGAHWTLLLTAGREAFGGPRSQRASALCGAGAGGGPARDAGRDTNLMRQHN
ncbi:hypothetical protein AB0E08_46335 [Streptomyces sp. NPDC048281]|uniref:hypothetical protein n=1 Tax=Streptomyces sp. NPDC048281 TaxID=3154715 RepID=UPI003443D88F